MTSFLEEKIHIQVCLPYIKHKYYPVEDFAYDILTYQTLNKNIFNTVTDKQLHPI